MRTLTNVNRFRIIKNKMNIYYEIDQLINNLYTWYYTKEGKKGKMERFDFIGFVEWDIKTNNITRDDSIEKIRDYVDKLNFNFDVNYVDYRHYNEKYGSEEGSYFLNDVIAFINSQNNNIYLTNEDDIDRYALSEIKRISCVLNTTPFTKTDISIVRTITNYSKNIKYGHEVFDTERNTHISITEIINFSSFIIKDLNKIDFYEMDNEAFLLYISQKD